MGWRMDAPFSNRYPVQAAVDSGVVCATAVVRRRDARDARPVRVKEALVVGVLRRAAVPGDFGVVRRADRAVDGIEGPERGAAARRDRAHHLELSGEGVWRAVREEHHDAQPRLAAIRDGAELIPGLIEG